MAPPHRPPHCTPHQTVGTVADMVDAVVVVADVVVVDSFAREIGQNVGQQ